MWKFIRYEWKHWFSSPMTWIFLMINTLLVLGAVSSDSVTIGGAVGSVHKNAPFVVQSFYASMSMICLLMTTAYMNASANRDFATGMYQFVFTSPISKSDYLFGKYIGAVTMAMLPLLGVSLGALFGPLMPWGQQERYGEVNMNGDLLGLLAFGIPNTIITGVFLYILAIFFRSNIVSFIGAMVILVLYGISGNFTKDIQTEWLANLLDPFGFNPYGNIAKYMTVDEKNAHGIPLAGPLLTNRLMWLGFSMLILVFTYFRFSFSTKATKAKKEKKRVVESLAHEDIGIEAKPSYNFSLATLWYLIKFETKAIIKNPTFIIITVIGLIMLVVNLANRNSIFGVQQYPVTYHIMDMIQGSFYISIIAIITFYSGVVVWKERDAKLNEIQDSTPVPTGVLFMSKMFAMIAAIATLLISTILIGVLAQTFSGYHRYQLDVYVKGLLIMDLLGFAFLVVIALFFHYVINNRYIAYFAFVAFVILNSFIWRVLKINSNMLIYGGTPEVTYSDMNGYGPFVPSTIWFNVYWSIFAALICLLTTFLYVRGKELKFKRRLSNIGNQFYTYKVPVAVCLVAFVICSGFVYYNTKVINKYDSPDEAENNHIEYEKKYKKYESLAQPRFYKFNYNIDIMPEQRSYVAKVEAWAKNITETPINELHFTVPDLPDSLGIDIQGAKLKLYDDKLNYRIYTLVKSLMPNDSIRINFYSSMITKGFENEVSFTQLTQNGTFFNNNDILPSLGYQSGQEISDKNKRVKFKLPKRARMPKLDTTNIKGRLNNYISNDADWVEVNTTLSTAPDQTAIAPGSLIKTWEANGKKYFNYKLDHQALNFYSFISAKYQVQRIKWKGIDLEVYYDKQHAVNVPNMLKSMEKSLDYYTKNFGPYYQKQCRIIEFPRYASFAQSFPGSMPYSEGIGFITDLRNVTKSDIDMVFYVVAHEMGHQYWAHQLIGADMQGSEMMSEGFAQYSALMVMEKEYGKDKMKKFLKYEMDGYLRGRSAEPQAEQPLMYNEHQQYIYYQKASVVLYYLKEMIGEDKVNAALRSLIDSFGYRQPPYTTSVSAVQAFKKVTPDSLQYLITDLFETITVFSNRTMEAKYKKVGNEYEVTFKTISEKFKADSLGKEKNVPLADYIDIGIFAEGEDSDDVGKPLLLQRLKLTKKENTFTFRVKEKPYQAGLDPYNYLIDRTPGDNLKKVGEE